MPDQSSLDVVILDYNELLCEPTPELLAKIEKVCTLKYIIYDSYLLFIHKI